MEQGDLLAFIHFIFHGTLFILTSVLPLSQKPFADENFHAKVDLNEPGGLLVLFFAYCNYFTQGFVHIRSRVVLLFLGNFHSIEPAGARW